MNDNRWFHGFRSLLRPIVTLAMIFGLGITSVADASFVLQMGLGSPTTVGTQVTIPINVVFTSTKLNLIDRFILQQATFDRLVVSSLNSSSTACDSWSVGNEAIKLMYVQLSKPGQAL